MKTTLDLNDDLMIAAKTRAAQERTSLKALVERGLRAELKRGKMVPPRRAIRWVTVAGGVPEGLDIADRASLYAFLRRRP